MKKKQLFLAATAILLASCTDTTYLGDKAAIGEGAGGVITFESSTPNLTRTGGPEAAEMLNNNFVVFGFKTMATGAQTVFDNYQVNFAENTAQKTASNVKDWEYVGYKNLPNGVGTSVGVTAFAITTTGTPNNSAAIDQTIKYWDFSASSYDFFAYSLGKGVTSGSTTTYATSGKMSASTYTLTGSTAELQACYISKKEHRGTLNTTNTNVQFSFLSFGTKVRLGIYETVPGYSVKEVKFYTSNSDANPGDAAILYDAGGTASIPNGGKYTVTFADDGYPVLTFETTTGYTNASSVSYGALTGFAVAENKEGAGSYLGRSAKAATFAGDGILVLPNPAGTELTLKVDYTLVSIDGSGETIKAVGGIAKVPANYAQWKPNFAYTYLFKITDTPNSTIGGVAGLYPITFDAVIVDTTEGTQETITTVEDPSITTYQNGVVATDSEYKAANGDIYVTVEGDAGALLPLKVVDNTNNTTTIKGALYTFDGNHTEAEIVKALKVRTSALDVTPIVGRNSITLTPGTLTITNKVGDKVFGDNMVGQFTPAAGNYAFVYTKTAPSATLETAFEIVPNLTAGTSLVGSYYCNYKYTAITNGDAQSGVTYYEKTVADPETYAPLATQPTFFGQDVTGLYTSDGTNYSEASGTAKTGTNYYIKEGDNYNGVVSIAYSSFTSTTLYTFDGTNYTAKGDAAFNSNTVYYQQNATDNTKYDRCVILPQLVTGYYIEDVDVDVNVVAKYPVKCPAGEKAIAGKKYYDKFDQNDGEYAVKVIKVQ